jgi:V/A-type H+/Na+-transporting ATPase subunit F
MKIAGFCDQDTAVGLRLAGIHELYIINEKNTKDLWTQISEKDDIGILFITEKISDDLEKYIKDFRIRNNLPIIVEIPDKTGRITGHVDFVSHLIKKAVGIEINK